MMHSHDIKSKSVLRDDDNGALYVFDKKHTFSSDGLHHDYVFDLSLGFHETGISYADPEGWIYNNENGRITRKNGVVSTGHPFVSCGYGSGTNVMVEMVPDTSNIGDFDIYVKNGSGEKVILPKRIEEGVYLCKATILDDGGLIYIDAGNFSGGFDSVIFRKYNSKTYSNVVDGSDVRYARMSYSRYSPNFVDFESDTLFRVNATSHVTKTKTSSLFGGAAVRVDVMSDSPNPTDGVIFGSDSRVAVPKISKYYVSFYAKSDTLSNISARIFDRISGNIIDNKTLKIGKEWGVVEFDVNTVVDGNFDVEIGSGGLVGSFYIGDVQIDASLKKTPINISSDEYNFSEIGKCTKRPMSSLGGVGAMNSNFILENTSEFSFVYAFSGGGLFGSRAYPNFTNSMHGLYIKMSDGDGGLVDITLVSNGSDLATIGVDRNSLNDINVYSVIKKGPSLVFSVNNVDVDVDVEEVDFSYMTDPELSGGIKIFATFGNLYGVVVVNRSVSGAEKLLISNLFEYGSEGERNETNKFGSFSPSDILKYKKGFGYVATETKVFNTTECIDKAVYGETVGSVKPIMGNVVAKQQTLSMRPVFGMGPMKGRRNLLSFSNRLNQSPWGYFGGSGGVSVDVSNSFMNNDVFILTSGIGDVSSGIRQSFIHNFSETEDSVAFSIFVRRGVGDVQNSFVKLNLSYHSNGVDEIPLWAYFDISEYGNIGEISSEILASCDYLGGGWFRLSVVHPTENLGHRNVVEVSVLYEGPPLEDHYSTTKISMPQFETGGVTRYQNVVNNSYIEENDDSVAYKFLRFDNVDDKLSVDIPRDMVGSRGELFVFGRGGGFIVPYTLHDVLEIGVSGYTNGDITLWNGVGDLIGFGFVRDKLTHKEMQNLKDYFTGMGASSNIKIYERG